LNVGQFVLIDTHEIIGYASRDLTKWRKSIVDMLIDAKAPTKLMDTYVSQHNNLRRFFTMRLGSREAAEDIVQDIAIRVRELDPNTAMQIQNHGAFIYRMGCNIMLDRLKQQRRACARDRAWTRTQLVEHNGVSVADTPDPDAAIAARQRITRILAILENLSPQCGRAFRLHKFDGLSHSQVADTMGITRSAVEKHVSKALKVLLRELD